MSLEPRQTRVCRVSVFHAAKLSRFRERGGFEDRFQTRSITYFHLPTSIGAGTHKPSILHVPRARSFRFKVLSIRLHQDPRGRSANQVSEERWPAICRSSANDKHETLSFSLSLLRVEMEENRRQSIERGGGQVGLDLERATRPEDLFCFYVGN